MTFLLYSSETNGVLLMGHSNSSDDIGNWRKCIGNSTQCTEILALEPLRRFAVAVGLSMHIDNKKPRLAHWAYFSPLDKLSELSVDGAARTKALFLLFPSIVGYPPAVKQN